MSAAMEASAVAAETGAAAAGAAQRYRRRHARHGLVLALLALALLASLALDVATGPSGMGLARLWQVLGDPGSVSRVEAVIVWNVRLPYALMAVLVGAALALAGAEMQTVLANALASPFTPVSYTHLTLPTTPYV